MNEETKPPLTGRWFPIDQTPVPTTAAARRLEQEEHLKRHKTFHQVNFNNKRYDIPANRRARVHLDYKKNEAKE